MSNIIDFKDAKVKQSPHTSGTIICLGCRHEWIGVCPVGVTDMECPSCGLMKGTHKYLVLPENGSVWQCGCGNNMFFVTELMNALCPNCGSLQRITDDGVR